MPSILIFMLKKVPILYYESMMNDDTSIDGYVLGNNLCVSIVYDSHSKIYNKSPNVSPLYLFILILFMLCQCPSCNYSNI